MLDESAIITVTTIASGGGSGGSGHVTTVTTIGGLMYFGITVCHGVHVLYTFITKGRKAAVEEVKKYEEEEYPSSQN